MLEEAVSGTTTQRYVWSPVYVDAMILRDRDTDANGTLDERLWVMQDANWNVVGLVNGSGVVVERYAYDAFGAVTVMNGSWTVGSTAYGWQFYHQGARRDGASGLDDRRGRWYGSSQGRWVNLDPIRYGAGDVNLFRYVNNSPLNLVDPSGMFAVAPMIICSMVNAFRDCIQVPEDIHKVISDSFAKSFVVSPGFEPVLKNRPDDPIHWGRDDIVVKPGTIVSQEQGALIHAKPGGQNGRDIIPLKPGNSSTILLPLPQPGTIVLGSVHSHPYTDQEVKDFGFFKDDPRANMPHSVNDAFSFLIGRRSGKEMYVVSRDCIFLLKITNQLKFDRYSKKLQDQKNFIWMQDQKLGYIKMMNELVRVKGSTQGGSEAALSSFLSDVGVTFYKGCKSVGDTNYPTVLCPV